jgi:hypothetical protein
MPIWKELEQAVSLWLKTFSSDTLIFRGSYQAIYGFPFDGFRSDGMLTNGTSLVAIEVEAGQIHPDTNVGKYWLLHAEYKAYEKIVLFHIYTPYYNSYGWRKKLAAFYADKMGHEVPIEYIVLDYRSATDFEAVLSQVKATIGQTVVEMFGIT